MNYMKFKRVQKKIPKKEADQLAEDIIKLSKKIQNDWQILSYWKKRLKQSEEEYSKVVEEKKRNTRILHGGTPLAVSIRSYVFGGEKGKQAFLDWAKSFPIQSQTSPLVHGLEETIQALAPFCNFEKAREYAAKQHESRLTKFLEREKEIQLENQP